MARSVKEWVGKTDDTPVPDRVRIRVLERFGNRCDPAEYAPGLRGCGRPIRSGDRWTCDHVKAIINGGENRERNLHPLCAWCTPGKDAADAALKSDTYHKKLSNFGGARRPKGRPLPGTRASGVAKKMDGSVVRRSDGKILKAARP